MPQQCAQLPETVLETYHPNIRRLEPSRICHHERCHNLLAIPRSVERWFEKIGRQHGSLPTSSFLHARIRPTHQQRQPTIPCSYCSGTYPTNVRRQEHDGRLRSTTRTLPHSRSHVPWTYVNEGSR